MKCTNASGGCGETASRAGTNETGAARAGGAAILSRKEAARHLGICLATLDKLDLQKTRIGRRVMFTPDTLARWIARNTDKPKRGKA